MADTDKLQALGKRLQSEAKSRYETEKRLPYNYRYRQYEPKVRGSLRRGGRIKHTGIYRLHRGERVIPARGRRGRRK